MTPRRDTQYSSAVYVLYVFMGVVVIVESLIEYYAASDVISEMDRTNYRLVLLSVYLLIAAFLIILARPRKRQGMAHLGLSPIVLFATLTLGMSLAINLVLPTPLVVVAPFLAQFVFYTLPRVPLAFNVRLFTLPFLVFTVLPIVLFIAFPMMHDSFVFHDNTFRGFGGSRSDFGYLLGMSTLIVLGERGLFFKLLFLILVYGIWLTESRATLVALGLSVSVMLWCRYKSKYTRILAMCCVLSPLMVFIQSPSLESINTTRLDLFTESGNRFGLYRNAIDQAVRSGLLFGSGRLYVGAVAVDGTIKEAHNAAIQSVLNFGIVVTLIWYWLVFRFAWNLAPIGKAFIVFLVVFGLFQPGYEAWFFAPHVFFTFLLAAFYSQRHKSRAEPSRPATPVRQAICAA